MSISTWVRRLRVAASFAVIAGTLAVMAFAGYWVASGGRWFIVRTPSMGTAAPVGTLLWVKPVDFVDLHRGEMITFRPPGLHTTYSHRIFSVNADGTLSTKGDANGSSDPWRLHASDVVGEVTSRWWGVGWLVRALPLLVVGGAALTLLVRRCTAPRWRLPASVLGAAFLASLSIYLFRPLVGAQQVSALPTDNGARATYISTGLFPLRLEASGGQHVDLRSGQMGTVRTTAKNANGKFAIDLHPLIPLWCWVALIAVCFLPAFWATYFRGGNGQRPRHRAA
ncbi:hypothetical protein [Jatrophihabitans endophyticus]|uniref:hypothetical protein n=1 Tax=Jatrophihabitans endophyticus TaxID=1206085 RepID=UPI0019F0F4DE|nr:hypothetical protein [Jatrophihabitans endophyticus]MBE7188977.1 hypothetical protein [Jatrophihabitans endophyticus]